MLNNITLAGRLTKDPELRYTANNIAVTSFTLAVDREGKDKQTDFIDCVAWRQTAEWVKNHFGKGNLILTQGRLQIRDWTDKEGKKRYAPEVVVDKAYFCEKKQKQESGVFAELDDEGDEPF
jgi:single-strand DNA-binding protein